MKIPNQQIHTLLFSSLLLFLNISGCNLSAPINEESTRNYQTTFSTIIVETQLPVQNTNEINIQKTVTNTLENTSTPEEVVSNRSTLTVTPNLFPCKDSYQSRLKINSYAQVSTYPPLSTRVRSNAGTDFQVLGSIDPGDIVKIIDGPKCANSWVWWKISVESTGLTGWTSEGDFENYWLIPIP